MKAITEKQRNMIVWQARSQMLKGCLKKVIEDTPYGENHPSAVDLTEATFEEWLEKNVDRKQASQLIDLMLKHADDEDTSDYFEKWLKKHNYSKH